MAQKKTAIELWKTPPMDIMDSDITRNELNQLIEFEKANVEKLSIHVEIIRERKFLKKEEKKTFVFTVLGNDVSDRRFGEVTAVCRCQSRGLTSFLLLGLSFCEAINVGAHFLVLEQSRIVYGRVAPPSGMKRQYFRINISFV